MFIGLFISLSTFAAAWTGTGFFVAPNGYLVTAAHVVKGSTLLQVRYHHKFYTAHVVAVDYLHDTAIIKIDVNNSMSYTININPQVGETMFLLGYPMPERFGWKLHITKGIVRGLKDRIEGNAFGCPGNSGGPIINTSNEVIGTLVRGISLGSERCSYSEQSEYIAYAERLAESAGVFIKTVRSTEKHGYTKDQVYTIAINNDSVVLIYGEGNL